MTAYRGVDPPEGYCSLEHLLESYTERTGISAPTVKLTEDKVYIDGILAAHAGPGKLTDSIPSADSPTGYFVPATYLCDCGYVLELYDPLTNECECGRLYNGGGQSLRPESEWEEQYDEEY